MLSGVLSWRRGAFAAALLLLAALAAVSCRDGGAAPETPTPEPTPTERPREIVVPDPPLYGVAGLIPPNFPNQNDDDWLALYASFEETGDVVGAYANWTDSAATAGAVPEVVGVVFELGFDSGIVPVVVLGVSRDTSSGVVTSVDWSDRAERERFFEAVRALASTFRPPYLGIGSEVNRLFQSDPTAFAGFVGAYREAYDLVKEVSPATAVFTVFQLEALNGQGVLFAENRPSEPQWYLLEQFEGRLDLLAVTSYPFLEYPSPRDIPDDYYSEAAARLDAPLAVLEAGWPSAPLGIAPDSPYGGTPQEQRDFVYRLFRLLEGVPHEMVLWAFPNDPGPAAGPAFGSTGLRENDGTPKPALAAWQEAIGLAP